MAHKFDSVEEVLSWTRRSREIIHGKIRGHNDSYYVSERPTAFSTLDVVRFLSGEHKRGKFTKQEYKLLCHVLENNDFPEGMDEHWDTLCEKLEAVFVEREFMHPREAQPLSRRLSEREQAQRQ